jgi:hypothetical protein
MIMSEDEIVHLIPHSKIRCEFIQRLGFASELIFHIVSQTIVPGPPVAESECNPRMKGTEQYLRQTVMEESAKETISERYRTQTVAVSETEVLVADTGQSRLLQLDHTKLLKIPVGPDVVIAFKKVHLHTSIHESLQSCQHPNIALRDHISVFIPEIPDISQEIQCFRLFGKRSEEVCKTTFPTCRIRNLKTQMNIGDKVCIPF